MTERTVRRGPPPGAPNAHQGVPRPQETKHAFEEGAHGLGDHHVLPEWARNSYCS